MTGVTWCCFSFSKYLLVCQISSLTLSIAGIFKVDCEKHYRGFQEVL